MTQNPSTAPAPFRRFTGASAWVLMATGVIVLVGGWALDVTPLKNVVPGTIAMKASTATALASLGAGLLLLRDPQVAPARRAAGWLCGLVPIVIGLAFLSEFLLGWNLGIDELPFRDVAGREQGVPHPGRLAPTTAVNLVLVGLALLTLGARPRRGWRPAEVLVVPVALVASMSLIGYTYSIPAFYGPGSAAKMALNTAVCFVIVAFGIAVARPHGRLLAFATATSPGDQMVRRLFPVVVCLPLLLGWLRLEASDAGVFGDRVGTWWLTATTIAGLIVLVWRASLRLNQADAGRVELERQLYALANHDALTGLFNRHRFEEEMARHAARVRRHGGSTTFLVLDLDCLKEVNDTLGHAAGDDLLAGVAAAITSRIRDTDVAARLGGDEFAVILHESSPDGALVVAQALRVAIAAARPESLGNDAWSTASIGVAHTAGTGDNVPRDLLALADDAMYEAKRAGGDRVAHRFPAPVRPGAGERRSEPASASARRADRIAASRA